VAERLKPWHLVGLLVAAHLALTGRFELAEDEAYYWVWSEHLAWGFFDHPPAIAAIIAMGTEILGDTEQGVRLVPALLGLVPLGVAGALAHDRILAIAVVGALPLFALGGLIATPDTPLVAAWALALWARLEERWIVFGIACGLAMLSKYTGVLLWPCLVLAEPARLRTRGPWIALAVAAAIAMPNVIWNLQHGGVSWLWQIRHVAKSHRPLDFVGAQVGLAGGLLIVPFVRFWVSGWRGDAWDRVLWASSAPLLVIATVAGGEANWAAPAYVGAAVAIASGERPRLAWAGVGVAAAVSLFALVHALHPLFFHPKDPLHRLRGGRVLGESVAAWGISPVYAVRYQEASLVAFYGKVETRTLPDTDRMDQFDLWPADVPAHALFVREDRGNAPLQSDRFFAERSAPNLVVAFAPTDDPARDEPIKSWQVYEVWK
jgi:4-amino-4-deoxy-L-arabinose transferase-like glycosyltransferase